MNPITDFSQLDLSRQYSYADYLEWEFAEWVELLGGYCRLVSRPGQTPRHQQVLSRLAGQIAAQWQDTAYESWWVPFPLVLGYEAPADSYNLLLPDLYIIRKEKPNYLDQTGWHGVPLLVAEVSDSRTCEIDQHQKLKLYEYFGVGEYWLVDLAQGRIRQYSRIPEGPLELATELTGSGYFLSRVLAGVQVDWQGTLGET